MNKSKPSKEKLMRRVFNLEKLYHTVDVSRPVKFTKRADSTRAPSNIFIFASSFNPPTIAHGSLIKIACSNPSCDELLLVLSIDHIAKTTFSATIAQRLLMIEELVGDNPKISIAITLTGSFLQMVDDFREYYRTGKFSFIMGLDNFREMLDYNTAEKLDTFFINNSVYIAPRGNVDTESIIMQANPSWRKNILAVKFPKELRNYSATTIRRAIKQGTMYKGLVDISVHNIIVALKLYQQSY